jgi:hypothetical protein
MSILYSYHRQGSSKEFSNAQQKASFFSHGEKAIFPKGARIVYPPTIVEKGQKMEQKMSFRPLACYRLTPG